MSTGVQCHLPTTDTAGVFCHSLLLSISDFSLSFRHLVFTGVLEIYLNHARKYSVRCLDIANAGCPVLADSLNAQIDYYLV